MNYLLAKKKNTSNTFYRILSQENKIYELTNLDSIRTYDVDYKLEDEEWFCISNFTNTDFCDIKLLKQDFNSAEYHNIKNDEYNKVKYFCAYQDNDDYCFQRFKYSNIVNKKWFSLGDPKIKVNEPIIIIKEVPDVIYRKSTNTLYFRNLIDAKNIFSKLEELYKEATEEETENFLNNNFINLTNEFDKSKVNSSNRKRIAMAMKTLLQFDDNEKKQIHSYIKEYCPNLKFSEEKEYFDIGNGEELKMLLFGIEERYYTTNVGGEKRLANSILRLE